MIKRLLLFCCILFSLAAVAQPYAYQSRATGNWNVVGTWNYWNGSAWVPATITQGTPTSSSSAVTIMSGHNVTQNASGLLIDEVSVNGTLTISVATTISNGTGNDLTIASGGTVTVSAGTLTNNGQIVNSGTFTNNATVNNTSAGTFTNNSSLTNPATKTFTNNGTVVNSGTISNAGTFNNAAGSLFQHSFTSSAGTIPTATWNTTSTLEILSCTGTSGPSGLNQSFGNVTWNYSSQPNNINLQAALGSVVNAVKGNLTIQSTGTKKLILDSTTNVTLQVAGNLVINAGTLVLVSGSGVITVSVGGNFTIASGGGCDMSSSSQNAYLNIGKDFTQATAATFGESGTSTNSRVMMNGSSAALTQNIESPGFTSGELIEFSIQQSGTTTTTCKIATGKTFVINPGTIFNVYANTLNTAGIPELTIDGTLKVKTTTWFLQSSPLVSVNGTWDHYDNTNDDTKSDSLTLQFKAGSTYKHNADGGQVLSALWAPTSTVEVSDGFITADSLGNGGQYFGNILWNSSTQTSSAWFGVATSSKPFNVQGNFTVSATGTGTLKFPDADFSIGGNLVVQNTAKLQLSKDEELWSTPTRTVTVVGNVSVLNTATLTVGSPNSGSTPETTNKIRDYKIALKGNFLHSSSTPLTSFIHRSFNSTLNDASYRLTVDFISSTTQTITQDTSYQNTVTYSGNGIANDATDDDLRGYNFYKISLSGTGTHVKALSDIKYALLTVASGDTLDFSNGTYSITGYGYPSQTGATTAASLSLSSGSVLEMGYSMLKESGTAETVTIPVTAELRTKHAQGISTTASTGCIQTTGLRTLSAANFTYNGSTAQVTGNGLPTPISGTLEIDNTTALATGGVTLTQNTAISGTFSLQTGKLITTGLTFTIQSGGTVSPTGGQAASFVEGPIKKNGNTAFIFPTGAGSTWARIGITAPSTTSDAFIAQYFAADPSTAVGATLNTGVDHISQVEYWNLTRSAGLASVIPTVTLYWENGTTQHGITSVLPADLHVGEYYLSGTSKWFDKSVGTITGTAAGSGTITNGTVATMPTNGVAYPFTFLSANGVNPLPVELLSFSGERSGTVNHLAWLTASELNNDYFMLQRSSDGTNFQSIVQIEGAGNSLSQLDYSYDDNNAPAGINYYRLQQVDYNGEFVYSEVVVLAEPDALALRAFPNPTEGSLVLEVSEELTMLEVYDCAGQLVFGREHCAAGKIRLDFVAPGFYTARASTANGRSYSLSMIKR